MSLLAVGLSHKSAPLRVLEHAAVSGDALGKLLSDVAQSPNVAGAFVVSTCNRVEIYAEVDKFHGGLSSLSDLLARHSGIPLGELTPHLYVHYEDRAVQHLLAVACGLESMVVGESQILGQVRAALALARDQATLSRSLGELGALALRTAKRAHTETRIDRAGANLVTVGVNRAITHLATPPLTDGAASAGATGQTPPQPAGTAPEASAAVLAGVNVLVVGAGSMSSLAATTAARMGAGSIMIANRTPGRAERLAAAVSGTTADIASLDRALAQADLVISCTGSPGVVISTGQLTRALQLRDERKGAADRPLVLLDLALPRDVEDGAGDLPGVHVIGLETLAEERGPDGAAAGEVEIAAVRVIVAEEFAARVSAVHAARVAPTVVALRAKAADVVDTELARLAGRLRLEDARTMGEVERAMHRVVDKLLHAPTVRVKELAGSPGGDSYEDALRVLFDLDPAVIDAVTRADTGLAQPGRAGPGPGSPSAGGAQ